MTDCPPVPVLLSPVSFLKQPFLRKPFVLNRRSEIWTQTGHNSLFVGSMYVDTASQGKRETPNAEKAEVRIRGACLKVTIDSVQS